MNLRDIHLGDHEVFDVEAVGYGAEPLRDR
jgi:hypothetical protein